jgi:hypothetical protein
MGRTTIANSRNSPRRFWQELGSIYRQFGTTSAGGNGTGAVYEMDP